MANFGPWLDNDICSSKSALFQVQSGSPGKGTIDKIYPVGNKICFINVMSSFDYIPLDGQFCYRATLADVFVQVH